MAERSVLVRIKGDPSDLVRAAVAGKAAIKSLRDEVKSFGDEVDKTNDRTAWLAQGILALAPAATTLGAGAVPVISGLATQMTVGAAAAGVMALAFNGVGDALSALNDYQLDPTTENLEQLRQTMHAIGPEGEEFVRFIDSLGPAFSALSRTARSEMFPGITEGITSFMELMPRFNAVVGSIASGIGELASTAGADLAGPEWEEFFTFLAEDARPILVEMGNTIGNFMQGFGSMIVAFGPLSADFSAGFESMSESFADWAAGLEGSTGFREFVSYVREAAPMALDFMGALATALVEIVEAAAPVGDLMLPALTSMLRVLAELADTPLGPIALGFAALTSAWGRLNALATITGSGVMSRATAGFRNNLASARMLTPSIGELGTAFYRAGQAVENQTTKTRIAMTQTGAFMRSIGPVVGQVGLLAFAASDLDDRMGLTNTATLTLAGSLAGPWGAAVGAGAGLLMDMKSASDQATEGFRGLDDAIEENNADALAASIAKAKKELEDVNEIDGVGDWFSDIAQDLFTGGAGEGITDVYTREIKAAEEALADMKRAQQEAAGETAYYEQLQAETAVLEQNLAAMRAKRQETLLAANAELAWETALLDARDAAKENNNVLRRNGDLINGSRRAGIEAKTELYGLAAAWNGLSDEAQNTPGKFKGAIRSFVDAATAMGMGEDEARDLARELLNLPSARVEVQIDEAMRRMQIIQAELDTIDRSIDVWVNVRRRTGYMPSAGGLGGPQVTGADGTTVPGPRYPYGDKVLAYLAPGEEVISNRFGQADRHRELLKAINANRLADGGTAGALLAARPQVNVPAAQVSLGGMRFVLEVPGMGQVMTRVVRTEMAADQRFRERLDDRD